MATHSSILAWRIPMDRGAWRATVHRVARVRHDLEIKPPPPPQSSPWKSGCIPFKKPETPPAPQSPRILLSSNSSVVWGNIFRIWGAPPLTWTWDPVNCFTQKALRRTCHRITEDTGTSLLKDDVWAGLLMCTADDVF